MDKNRLGESSCEEDKANLKLLGPVATFFTLIKGFVCTGILYLPKGFVNGGWGFSIFSLVFTACLSYYSSLLILEVRLKTKSKSYTECGEKVFGNKGRIIVNIPLAASQIGFVCAFLYFILENCTNIVNYALGISISRNLIALIWLAIISSFSLVRRIEIFAPAHLFANIMVIITLSVVITYGISNMV